MQKYLGGAFERNRFEGREGEVLSFWIERCRHDTNLNILSIKYAKDFDEWVRRGYES
jgi:hypothetical protein